MISSCNCILALEAALHSFILGKQGHLKGYFLSSEMHVRSPTGQMLFSWEGKGENPIHEGRLTGEALAALKSYVGLSPHFVFTLDPRNNQLMLNKMAGDHVSCILLGWVTVPMSSV